MFIVAVIVFSLIILSLTASVVIAGEKLSKKGNVTITINGDAEHCIKTAPTGTLLGALASQNIFIPSACGGGGTCAMCRVQVESGAGQILPIEVGHFTRAQRMEGYRLSCQVKVRDNLKIHVHEELFNIKSFNVTVVSNNNVATFIKEIVFKRKVCKNLKEK